jgi:hypothetical protein
MSVYVKHLQHFVIWFSSIDRCQRTRILLCPISSLDGRAIIATTELTADSRMRHAGAFISFQEQQCNVAQVYVSSALSDSQEHISQVRTADGKVTDSLTVDCDFVPLGHNSAFTSCDDRLAILCLRSQTIKVLQVPHTRHHFGSLVRHVRARSLLHSVHAIFNCDLCSAQLESCTVQRTSCVNSFEILMACGPIHGRSCSGILCSDHSNMQTM